MKKGKAPKKKVTPKSTTSKLKRKKIDSDSEEEEVVKKVAKIDYTRIDPEDLSEQYLLSLALIKKGVGKQSFWKGLNYYQEGASKVTKESAKKDVSVTISGMCQGVKQKEPYEQEVTIRLPTDENMNPQPDWVGRCDCDNAKNKGNICSHQVALLLVWVDDKSVNVLKTSDTTIKNAPKVLPISKEEKAQIKEKKEDLEELSVKALKGLCRHNEMIQSGTKPELVEKIAECQVLGVIPKCSTCGGGRPKYDKGLWFCEGYRDDVTWQDCNFVDFEYKRVPWKIEDEEK